MNSSFLAVIAAALAAAALTDASAADRSVPVNVTNAVNAPVPVLVTNPQAGTGAVPRSVFTDVFGGVTANVLPPPGAAKRFVVKHLDMYMVGNISGVPLTDATCLLTLHQGSISFTIALHTLHPANVFGGMGLSLGEYLVLGPGDALDATCLSNPANSSGRFTVSGDLLSVQ